MAFAVIAMLSVSSMSKSMPMLNRLTLDALIAAAHQRGKLAVVHARSQKQALEAMEAGAGVLVHLFTGSTASPTFASSCTD